MMISTKNLLATSLALLISAPAFAGASLDSLIGGGTLVSNNGKLVFSDFQFTPGSNVPANGANSIDVTTLDSGLLFGSPIFIDSATGIIDFDIAYKASGVGAKIISAAMQTNGAYSGEALAGAVKTIRDLDNNILAEVRNAIGTGNLSASDAAAFAAQDAVNVGDSFSAFGGGGGGAEGFVEVRQTFETLEEQSDESDLTKTPTTAVPSPTAALAGFALLGLVGMRRRRG